MRPRTVAAIFFAGATLAFLARRKGSRAVSCDDVGSQGGHLAGMRYLERVVGGGNPDEPLPLVVFFHSYVSRPEDFSSYGGGIHGPARVLIPEGPYTVGSGRAWVTQPSITSDQGKLLTEFRSTGAKVAEFLQAAVRCRPTVGAPVVTGSSQGGHMSYLMASQYPGLVEGAVALAGWIPEPLWNPRMAQTFGAHGTLDASVPYERTRAFWDAMKAAGAELETQTFPVGHTTSGMTTWWRARVNDLLGYPR